ncbi:MAG: DUF4390 domain-containing protein [Acidobacteriota bacterium]
MKAFFAALGLLAIGSLEEPNPRITDLVVQLDGPRVEVLFSLQDAFANGLNDRIDSGLPTAVTYEIQLLQPRRAWLPRTLGFDRKVTDRELQVMVKHDAVNAEYLVSYRLDGKLLESQILGEFQEVESAVTCPTPVALFNLDRDGNGEPFSIRVRADLGSKTILSFIPTRVTTAWIESRRFLPPA